MSDFQQITMNSACVVGLAVYAFFALLFTAQIIFWVHKVFYEFWDWWRGE